VTATERRARRLLSWYPRSWRETHEEEFVALLEDSIVDRPFWPGRSLNIVLSALRVRSCELRASHRRMLLSSSVPLVVLVAVIGFATNGFGLLSLSGPTKGGMPYSPPRGVAYNKLPDYLSVYIGPNDIGYTQGLRLRAQWSRQRSSARSDRAHLRQQPDDTARPRVPGYRFRSARLIALVTFLHH